MADNIKVKGSDVGTAVNVATDEIGGVHYPIYKQSFGGDGSQTPVSLANPLPTDDLWLQVRKGGVTGHTTIQKFGAVQTGSTAWTPVTSSGTYQTPIAATALVLVSTDNTEDLHPDNGVGTGAHLVRVYGLKTPASTAEEYEDVKLNGTTNVNLVDSWWRVYRMKVIQSGAYASATGASHNSTITLKESGGTVWAVIEALGGFGLGQSEIACYSIPTGKTAYVMVQHVDVAGTKDSDIAFFVRENADDVTTPFTGVMQVKTLQRNIPAGTELHLETKGPLLSITGPADMGWMAKAASASGSVDVEIDFEILVVDD